MLRMELPGKRKQKRQKRRFIDAVKEDMTVVQVTEEDAEDRTKMEMGNPVWRRLPGEAEEKEDVNDKITSTTQRYNKL